MIPHPPCERLRVRIGAIDVGTNSIHLVVVEVDAESTSTRTVFRAREMVRLGSEDALERGVLGKKAMARGVDAIARFARLAQENGARRVRAVATSAVRESSNGVEFAQAVERACGIPLEIVSEKEEARLIYLGVASNFPIHERLACIIDIGGGSTEFIIADGRRPYLLESVRLGSLRLYEMFLRGEEPPYPSYSALVAHIKDTLAPVLDRIREFNVELCIGTSGTIMGLATIDAAERGRALAHVHGESVFTARLRDLETRLFGMSENQRRSLVGMNPRRADIIIAGCAILTTALEGIGARSLTVSEHALRDGVVVDFVHDADIVQRLDDRRTRRRDSVLALANRFQTDGIHERAIARIALLLFDALAAHAELRPDDRELLYAAAMLHDVGRLVNPSGHHKHSAYIVRNALLDGWADEELAVLAAVVRYHRKALPRPSHAEWDALEPAQRRRVWTLAGILRLADGLDARHQGLARDVSVIWGAHAVTLECDGEDDVVSELAAGAAKSDLLAKALGRPIVLRGVNALRKEA